MDLLLFLIRRAEVDIADIPIKVFDFTDATAIVGVNPAHIDLIV